MLKTSRDPDYQPGDLSAFPAALDGRSNLFEAKNNARTSLEAMMDWNSDTVFLVDGSLFPASSGVVRVGDELVFYTTRSGNKLTGLLRGFMDTVASRHASGTVVTAPCISDMHNAVRDVIMKCETKVGLRTDEPDNADGATLWSRAYYLRRKWFTPRARFYSFGQNGHVPLNVVFVDFSIGEPVRWLWDFGDGVMSTERNPSHVYENPGTYDVSLTIFTAADQFETGEERNFTQGASSIVKKGYVRAFEDAVIDEVLFYARGLFGGVEQPVLTGTRPFTVRFYDQTPGDVVTRIWSFGDGTSLTTEEPTTFMVEHTYNSPGIFKPSLAVSDGVSVARRLLDTEIRVI